MTKLLCNAIITPDGTRLESMHRHDYKEHLDKNGEVYMVDGGLDYIRRNMTIVPAVEIDVHTESPHSHIRENFKWGTRGKTGKDPLKYVQISKLDTDHIKAIIETQTHLQHHIYKVFEDELVFRSFL